MGWRQLGQLPTAQRALPRPQRLRRRSRRPDRHHRPDHRRRAADRDLRPRVLEQQHRDRLGIRTRTARRARQPPPPGRLLRRRHRQLPNLLRPAILRRSARARGHPVGCRTSRDPVKAATDPALGSGCGSGERSVAAMAPVTARLTIALAGCDRPAPTSSSSRCSSPPGWGLAGIQLTPTPCFSGKPGLRDDRSRCRSAASPRETHLWRKPGTPPAGPTTSAPSLSLTENQGRAARALLSRKAGTSDRGLTTLGGRRRRQTQVARSTVRYWEAPGTCIVVIAVSRRSVDETAALGVLACLWLR